VPAADSGRVLKTIEGFAVECSINKVWTSETLAFAVDEAVQIFGGNGYSREFPAERAYRDARITRIYEGTNEINRLIIPTRLLKASPELFTAERARALLAVNETAILPAAKRLTLAALGYAVSTYGDTLKDAQEVLGHIADMAIEAYAVESVQARVAKSGAGAEEAPVGDIARVYASDAIDRIAHAARQVVAALEARDAHAADLRAAVQNCAALPGVDTITARRRIADAVIAAGRYPF
jgi:alkylation response protein AidB-like acyl-CoA dehydrogenase